MDLHPCWETVIYACNERDRFSEQGMISDTHLTREATALEIVARIRRTRLAEGTASPTSSAKISKDVTKRTEFWLKTRVTTYNQRIMKNIVARWKSIIWAGVWAAIKVETKVDMALKVDGNGENAKRSDIAPLLLSSVISRRSADRRCSRSGEGCKWCVDGTKTAERSVTS